MAYDPEYHRRYREQNKEAIRARGRAWYLKNADKVRTRSRKWSAGNPEQKVETQRKYRAQTIEERRAYMRDRYKAKRDELIAKSRLRRLEKPQVERDWYLRTEYGITLVQYERLFEKQSGGCAICGRNQKRLCVDHDHISGRVRGLLCNSCNNGLGRFKDNPKSLRKAADYLESEEMA